MKHPTMKTAPDFSERELRDSGLPPEGGMGAAKQEAWSLVLGVGILLLIVLAAIIDTQL